MKSIIALPVLLAVSATAFHVGVPPARISSVRESSTARPAGYIPDGLTEQEYETMKKKNADSVAKSKKYYKEKKFESLDSFMKGMEKTGRKHTFAKVDESLSKLPPAGARGVKQ